jgi:hypothetical protein
MLEPASKALAWLGQAGHLADLQQITDPLTAARNSGRESSSDPTV